jgi:phosphohistidine phosphatase
LKYPTSAVAMLRAAEPWDRLTLHGATLVTFHVPR